MRICNRHPEVKEMINEKCKFKHKKLATTDTILYVLSLCLSVLNSSSLFISSAKSEAEATRKMNMKTKK